MPAPMKMPEDSDGRPSGGESSPEDRRAEFRRWLKSGEVTLHPLTYPQREIWEASPVPAHDVANHICAFISVKGSLSQKESEDALQRVLERQPALRTSFVPGKEGPLQLIRRSARAEITSSDVREAGDDEVKALMEHTFREPFDMLRGPLYRTRIFRRGEDEIIMAFAIHHAIADGWTLGVFVQDLCGAYLHEVSGATEPLPPLALEYTSWDAAEKRFWQPAEVAKRLDFWQRELAGHVRIWRDPSPTGSTIPSRWVTSIPEDLTAKVRSLARSCGTTLFSTLLAAFQVAVASWSGTKDILVGTPVANRNRATVRETMGYFSGIVPLRGHVNFDDSFREMAARVQDQASTCFAEAMPFAELVRCLGEPVFPGRNPFFQIRFALQNHPIPDVDLPGLSLKLRMQSTGTARFNLACEVTEDGGELEVVWLHKEQVLDRKSVEELDQVFRSVIAKVVVEPTAQLASLIS